MSGALFPPEMDIFLVSNQAQKWSRIPHVSFPGRRYSLESHDTFPSIFGFLVANRHQLSDNEILLIEPLLPAAQILHLLISKIL
jgi:hypothetical protein